jgi:hypothetical protein
VQNLPAVNNRKHKFKKLYAILASDFRLYFYIREGDMNIRKACMAGLIVCIFSIAVLMFCVYRVAVDTASMKTFAKKRLDSILLAQEVRATSSGLTANARAYANSGATVYEEAFWNLVKIRAGEMHRPHAAPVAPGQLISFDDLLVAAGDLDAPSPVLKFSSRNEFGLMISSVGIMVGRLKKRIRQAEQKTAEAEEQKLKAYAAVRRNLRAR